MPENQPTGALTIMSERLGSVTEVSQFLKDLEAAYSSLYELNVTFSEDGSMGKFPLMFNLRIPYFAPGLKFGGNLSPDMILPEHQLVIRRIRIESPGFWEFAASLNPLQQLREYLNDRHSRRQDKQFRETAEGKKLQLENELLQHQIWEKENAILHDRIKVLREVGYSDEEIRQIVWAMVGKPLVQLGKHQDSKLISSAE